MAVDKFILATRDSGYKDTSNAVAEVKAVLNPQGVEERETLTIEPRDPDAIERKIPVSIQAATLIDYPLTSRWRQLSVLARLHTSK